MQIRISDMLDNASELIEENGEVRNTTNNDRIKKMVFSEIDCTCLLYTSQSPRDGLLQPTMTGSRKWYFQRLTVHQKIL